MSHADSLRSPAMEDEQDVQYASIAAQYASTAAAAVQYASTAAQYASSAHVEKSGMLYESTATSQLLCSPTSGNEYERPAAPPNFLAAPWTGGHPTGHHTQGGIYKEKYMPYESTGYQQSFCQYTPPIPTGRHNS